MQYSNITDRKVDTNGLKKELGTARIKTYTIAPVKEYSSAEIRAIRMKAGMTQSVFAAYMGVSRKTVEAWEGGRTHPSGHFIVQFPPLTIRRFTPFPQ